VTVPATVLLGIRHHGPGSARAVRRALAAYQPDVVLIEGPPEADELVGWAGHEQLTPPVALLAYPLDSAQAAQRAAAFWPLADFSPEWQAIAWAVAAGVPVRFCDLPAAHRFADAPPGTQTPAAQPPDAQPPDAQPSNAHTPDAETPDARTPDGETPDAQVPVAELPVERIDPIGALAAAAGYDDPERWWEDVVEHRLAHELDPADELAAALAPFQAIGEAMAAVRADAPVLPEAQRLEEERREAYMRGVLRAATKEHAKVAVVCGAWHVPALSGKLPAASADAATLRGLPRTKVAMTWVPWTHGRLAAATGYGAGVSSPGWYRHLFRAQDRPVTRWLVKVAGLLRQEGVPVSSAHVIEGVRLAETLATLRGRPLAGLAEVTEATRAVLCEGDELRLELVNRKLVIGERLGRVPDDTPGVPLARDIAAQRKRLRLAPSALETVLDLDLRKETDLGRSHLLHRLQLLGIDWGRPAEEGHARRGKGTFWESWQLCWRPEFAIDAVLASAYGTTVEAAATAKAQELATGAQHLGEVTALVERCLLANLTGALPVVLRALDERVALDSDVTHLMSALPALARSLRYGDVRGTDLSALRVVTAGLVVRVCVGLPSALAALDDNAAAAVREQLDAVHAALGLLADEELTGRWLDTLTRLAGRDDLHGLLGGRLVRLLLDSGRLDTDEAGRRMGLVLTPGETPARAAAWIEGFLIGGGLLLVHDPRLLALIDQWLSAIAPDIFTEVLPLLRRGFGAFPAPERRAIGERARHLGNPDVETATGTGIDPQRAARVLPTLALLQGRTRRPVDAMEMTA
jgi:Family of unknown function (DUF5682)